MNKIVLGLGILLFIVGVILVVLDVAGVFVGLFITPFSKSYDFALQDFETIVILVVGIVFIYLGKKK